MASVHAVGASPFELLSLIYSALDVSPRTTTASKVVSAIISLVLAFGLVTILLVGVGVVWDAQMRKKQRDAQAKDKENDGDPGR